ncbi:MAG: hypothetical protein ABIV48_00370, partial [Pyrinomonadaceae bacterium]
MKLMFPKHTFVSTLLALFVISMVFADSTTAQSKKAVPAKKPAAKVEVKRDTKRSEKQAKNAKTE